MSGPSPLLFTEVIRRHARHRSGATAVSDEAGAATYRELWAATDAAVALLAGRGVTAGDRVLFALDPGAGYLALMLGALRLGAMVAPLNTRLVADEVAEYVRRIAPTYVVTEPAHAGLAPDGVHGVIQAAGLHRPGSLVERVGGSSGVASPGELPIVAELQPAFAFPTGGTTGLPKAAVWTHRSITLASASSCIHLRVRPDDRELYISPFFHVTLIPGILATLYAGGHSRIIRRFDPATCAAALASGAVTRLFGTPTVLERMLATLPAEVDRGARPSIVFGSTRNDPGLPGRLMAAFPGAQLFSGYGSTEVGAVVRLLPEDFFTADRGVGRPVSGVQARIVDPAGRDVPTGAVGEVAIGSPWQMAGYLGGDTRDGGEEVSRLADGSLLTGDAGFLDDNGYLHLSGRLKETIKTGGETVFPDEVEDVLLLHPAVADCAVVGADDAEWGERVVALVVPAPGAEVHESDLHAHCRGALAGFKVPKQVVVVSELPYTANLKLDRNRLRSLVTKP